MIFIWNITLKKSNFLGSYHYLAIMLPENVYNEMLVISRIKAVSIFGLILLLFLLSGYLLNKKYVEPIVGDLQQLRSNPNQRPSSDLQELDAATVNELIEKIVIHSPEKIGGKKHVTIEVYFTYVGKIRIPLAKPELLTEKPV